GRAAGGWGSWRLSAVGGPRRAAEWATRAAPVGVLFTVGLAGFLAPLPRVLASRWRSPPIGTGQAVPPGRWRHPLTGSPPAALPAAAVLPGAPAAVLAGPPAPPAARAPGALGAAPPRAPGARAAAAALGPPRAP